MAMSQKLARMTRQMSLAVREFWPMGCPCPGSIGPGMASWAVGSARGARIGVFCGKVVMIHFLLRRANQNQYTTPRIAMRQYAGAIHTTSNNIAASSLVGHDPSCPSGRWYPGADFHE